MVDNNVPVRRFSFKNLRGGKKTVLNRLNGDPYFYVKDFSQMTESKCINFDKYNQQIYLDNLKLYEEVNKKILHTPIKISDRPKPPPQPSNYEKFNLWKQRHTKYSAEDQTFAIFYLLSKNIKINLDNSTLDRIEPFEAIEYAKKVAKENNEEIKTSAIYFLNNIYDHSYLNSSKPEHYNVQQRINYFSNRRTKLYPDLEEDDNNQNTVQVAPSAPPNYDC